LPSDPFQAQEQVPISGIDARLFLSLDSNQKKIIIQALETMQDFAVKHIAPEAARREAKIAVFVAPKRTANDAEYTTFLYKEQNLLGLEAGTNDKLYSVEPSEC